MQTKDEKERGAIESGRALESVTAYRFAMEASDAAWDDASTMKCEPLLAEVAPQLIRAIGSVAANIAEGYARRSARDRIRFYEYALGSVEESTSLVPTCSTLSCRRFAVRSAETTRQHAAPATCDDRERAPRWRVESP
jgi:four helix bundle protein